MEYKIQIKRNKDVHLKQLESEKYNYVADMEKGSRVSWGETVNREPEFNPFGPEVVDMEITSACTGPAGTPCVFCYKGNVAKGKNMSFDTFVKVFHALPRTVTNISFGTDGNLTANPDLWKMLEYCRINTYNHVAPTVTVANITKEDAIKLAMYCNTVSVSRYANKDWCYDSVKHLLDAKNELQRNNMIVTITVMVAKENYDLIFETIEDLHNDWRLHGLHSFHFMFLKTSGRGHNYTDMSTQQFRFLMEKYLAVTKNGHFFDRCSSAIMVEAANIDSNVNICHATLYECYINAKGEFSFCSYMNEYQIKTFKPIDMTKVTDFEKEVWNHPSVVEFRKEALRLNAAGLPCQVYNTRS